jgi:hypothetical protein
MWSLEDNVCDPRTELAELYCQVVEERLRGVAPAIFLASVAICEVNGDPSLDIPGFPLGFVLRELLVF